MIRRDRKGKFVKGHKVPKEWKEINRKVQTGKKHSDITKKKHSISLKKWYKKPENKRKFLESIKEPSIKRRKWKISKEELYDLYWNKKLSMRQIARKFGIGYNSVYKRMKRENIQIRTSKEGSKLNPGKLTEKGRKSLSESTIKKNQEALQDPRYIKQMLINLKNARNNITEESIKKMGEKNSFTWLDDYKHEIIKLYKNGDSTEKIGKKFNVCRSVILRLLKKWKIKINPWEGIEKVRTLEKEETWLNKRNKNIGKSNKGKIMSESTNLKNSEIHKKLWENEDFAKRMFKSFQVKPNIPEKVIIKLLKKNNLPFHYVGDGKSWINGKNPDFISTNGEKKVIEMHGRAFHDPNSKRGKVVEIPHYKTEKGTIEHYEKNGYSCLVIWDNELDDQNKVLNKIQNFS